MTGLDIDSAKNNIAISDIFITSKNENLNIKLNKS